MSRHVDHVAQVFAVEVAAQIFTEELKEIFDVAIDRYSSCYSYT